MAGLSDRRLPEARELVQVMPPAESTVRRVLLTYPRFVKRHGVLRGVLLAAVAGVAFAAMFPSQLAPFDPTEIGFDVLYAPGVDHWLGTDGLGRDVLSRLIFGARPTLIVALFSVSVGIGIGVPLGLIAGFGGRWISGLIMRAVDIVLAFPGLLMALIVVTLLGPGLRSVVIAIAIVMIPIFARMVYAATLSIKQRAYIDLARVIGVPPVRILAFHVAPNLASQVAVLATSALGWAILVSATLNFLGFGLSPPTADWGLDLAYGRQWLQQAWWLAMAPGLAITLTIFSANMLGDVVADVSGGGGRTSTRERGP